VAGLTAADLAGANQPAYDALSKSAAGTTRGETGDCVRTRPVNMDGRLTEATLTRCGVCDNGERFPTRRPYVEERDGRVAVVTAVPVEECLACGEVWIDEAVARRLD
jgi:YgiT-type zinc finger domain-containing protein